MTKTVTELRQMAEDFPRKEVGIVLKGHAGSVLPQPPFDFLYKQKEQVRCAYRGAQRLMRHADIRATMTRATFPLATAMLSVTTSP